MTADPRIAADLAALRRRLYAPDVTERDRERYATALAAQGGSEPASAPEVPVVAEQELEPGPRRRRTVAVAVAVAVAAASIAAFALAHRSSSAPSATPSPSATAVPLSIPASARAAFAAALLRGDGADLAAYLFDHPEARPPELTTLTRAATEEHTGTGGATVSLEPSTEANQGGHVSVILTLGTRTDATWRVVRIALDRVQQVAERSGAQSAGLPYSSTAAYSGRAPTLLSVSVPRGARWDALVVFSN